MKRSEMLKFLYDTTDKFIANNTDENLIDVVLDECVKLGMLPPPSVKEIYDGDNTNFEVIYDWEDEND